MKLVASILLFISLFAIKGEAQNKSLSEKIVGDWVFQYAEAKDLLVDNPNVKDSIIVNIAKNKELVEGQVLSYTKEGVLRITDNDTISEGTYRIDGNVEILTFDHRYIYEDPLSIEGDTLRIDFDQTEYFRRKVIDYILMKMTMLYQE